MSLFRNPDVRPPAVAQLFYPGDARSLADEVTSYLEQTQDTPLAPGFPKAVIVPHAGYIYSGPVAASAYDLLRPARGVVRRAVVLGPCHRVPVRGLALPAASAFDTPLGRIPLDEEAIASIRGLPQVVESAATHAQEHALEVQLPFLQQVLGEFSLVPLVVGSVAPEKVAEVLEHLWGGDETLFVISSDLSHYHSYEAARRIDGATVQAILGFDAGISHEQACGATPVAGALIAARRKGLAPKLLDCRNSGDTAGGKDQVVGYASFAFAPGSPRYEAEHGRKLLQIARASISAALGLGPEGGAPAAEEPWLREWRASFVTLMHKEEELRGCVGTLEAQRPLAADVVENARAAAFQDTRFKPLTREELARTDIEVSLLSAPKRLRFEGHADLIARLRPGVDGVILEQGDEKSGKRATFLPQVWEGLPDPEQFIAHLKQKAGIPQNASTQSCRVKRYTVLKWREVEFRQ
ncbi:MAG: AmmeMemoRadiSam system protein B [Betaproteobacteria bacterium]|nr:MAG: AmmeMemoRadiSam system protein B [Betaproteobacteria bacterium]